MSIIASDDPSVVDFGVFTPAWRQICSREVPARLASHVPAQTVLNFAEFGFITDVDTTEFSGGSLTFTLTQGATAGNATVAFAFKKEVWIT